VADVHVASAIVMIELASMCADNEMAIHTFLAKSSNTALRNTRQNSSRVLSTVSGLLALQAKQI